MDEHAVPDLPGRGSEKLGHDDLQQQKINAMFPDDGADTSFQQQYASDTRRIDDGKRGMSNRTAKYEKKVPLHAALQPAVYCNWSLR